MSQWEEVPADDQPPHWSEDDEAPQWAVVDPDQDQTGTVIDHTTGPTPAPAPPVAGFTDPDDDHHPFGGVERVDGLVYSDEELSPELQWNQQPPAVPPPPVRQPPMPPAPVRAEPWKPGPDPTPPKPAGDSRVVKLLFVTLVPLAFLAALGMLVYKIMGAYGLG